MTSEQKHLGLAGQLAQNFIRSKLTVLMVVASLAFGLVATLALPREEEPQINVPMFDVFVGMPGASAREVEERLINTGERKFWEIPDVEYVYSTAEAGRAMFILRFKVGTDPEEAMTRVYTKTFANQDFLPPGATSPLVKPRSIDDVPILALDLTGGDAFALRRQAAALRQEISAVPGVSETEIIGGHRRQFLVHFDPAALTRRRLTPLELAGALQAANTRLPAGTAREGDRVVAVETDARVRTAEDLKRIVVGVSGGVPVTVADVARVTDGPDEDERFVSAWTKDKEDAPAVTLAVSKRRGQNATRVAEEVLHRVDASRSVLLAPETQIAVTRNYGETAKEKSDELLFHMALATLSVTILIAFFLGAREALVVLIAIPVTLALTLLVYYLLGYTLNRITLFALIFSIGILVDDAIVVVENIHRHFAMKDGRSIWRLSVDAVAEVGNPTILATWAVIAAILPMAFVSGLMGPYMRPIPVGASVAMLFSLGIAFVISPWAFAHILEWWKPKNTGSHGAGESALDRLYRRFMGRLLSDAKARWSYLGGMVVLLLASFGLVYFKAVTVKMLPFDNKNEFEVVLTLPEGSAVQRTKAAADDIARVLLKNPHVERVTSYVGAAAPYNFNGLVRHYFLRLAPHQADLTVNLTHKKDRSAQSHAIASALRPEVQTVADRYGARVQVAEVPPGPPVLSTLVFEIYGPDNDRRDQFARDLQAYLRTAEGVVDVDTYVPSPEPQRTLAIDREKATLNGLPASMVGQTVGLSLAGQTVGLAHTNDKEPVEIRLRLPVEKRAGLSGVKDVALMSRNGTLIPLARLAEERRGEKDPPIYHKNLQRVSYVIADVAGRQESPVYAILSLRKNIQELAREKGYPVTEYFASQPGNSLEQALKWDGEWQITHEVFRDLGLAFAFALLLIYVLVVGWFKSFTIPLVVMVPIPLTLVGILPGHWLMGVLTGGGFFTATSMIGFIAGAGIVVRNSIILVDFIHLRLAEGMPLKEAVIDAGAVRFRPMLLTAAAVVVGAGVILFDPIFQGLAVALMAGEIASTLLSRMAVPVLYYMLARRFPPDRP
ncbi:MAG: efflux RND transporter permease subunit [Elusimicrobia bacterium]|jgi:multidrug efflux pump subunit AcrB|nr:efflux RND transporter permease subunit [Elusimicrobiota bacterium]MBK7207400.1 efflux RND transporter permease subunit [Elusimicrobiota bacterium]MBK7573690.1 efflux RND transporter permease subunit [Elusimicrobiota bacterium]MBK7689288.1 efflux RND transporter permease subunit [Elusimicrobiota bacterium]MBK8125833.1 efflux RND transporter permease subunit [Elusimicrobiota bacterium]